MDTLRRNKRLVVTLCVMALGVVCILLPVEEPEWEVHALEAQPPTVTPTQAWVASPTPTPSPTPELPDRWRDAEGPEDVGLSWDDYLDLTLGGRDG